MRVLFVFSGNSKDGITPIVKAQADSLIENGIEVDFFPIVGKGYKGYLSMVLPLRKHYKSHNFDVVHAHYSQSAFVASLAMIKPLVVSLMGSDVNGSKRLRFLTKMFSKTFGWKALITKSEEMRNNLSLKDVEIIPNGVDIHKFQPIEKELCQTRLKWDKSKTNILFAANPNRQEKNFKLASEALQKLNNSSIQIHALENIPHDEIPIWLNAADVVLLTSLWEGSPNVIKEAMACNRPVVCTDVGDIRWLFGNEEGHYISGFNPDELAETIEKAQAYSLKKGSTQGRDRIIELNLDAKSVAKRIVDIYSN